MVDVSDVSSCGSGGATVSSAASLLGKATASFDSCRFCRLFRLRDARGGNVAFSDGMKY